MHNNRQKKQEKENRGSPEWEEMLDYYHVEKIEELITIMQNQSKSVAYSSIKNQTFDNLGVSNLKAAYQQKRQLLSNMLHGKNKAQLPQIPPKQTPADKEMQRISKHSYEELINYFEINKNPQVIKNIVLRKYRRCEVVRTHRFRKNLWVMLTGLDFKHQQYPNMYSTLSKYQGYQDFFGRVIHADVIRTIHEDDKKFKEEIMEKMERILFSFARRNPYIGYCQGVNFILNFIITMQFTEEESFWLLASVLEETIPFSYYTNMSGVAADIKIIQFLFRDIHPKSAKKLAGLEVQLSIFVLEWLVCLFTSTLPFYLLVIVWDFLLLEGSVALIKVTLILLQTMAEVIDAAQDFADFFRLYQKMKKKTAIEQQNFLVKYSEIYIDQEILTIVRRLMELEVKIEKEEVRKTIDTGSSQKWREGECNVEWPICFHQLRKHKQDDGDVDVWVFKDENGPRIISDYLDLRHRKSYKSSEDNREESKKLIIGRIPHICDFHSYKQKQEESNRGRELEEFELGIRRFNKNLEGVLTLNYSSADFFRRVTANSYAFAKLSKKKN